MKVPAFLFCLAAIAGLWLGSFAASAQRLEETPATPPATNSPLDSLRWRQGPGKVPLGGIADLVLPAGFSFLSDDDARTLLRSLGSVTLGNEVGFIAPPTRDWFIVVRFLDRGYVKVDGAGTLDSAQLLQTLRQLDEAVNRSRIEAGSSPVTVQGWEIEPLFTPAAHRLEWAVRAATRERTIINHSIGLLGRSGVIQFYLVDQRRLATTTSTFRELAAGLQFHPGEQYTSYRPGDRVAAGGLESLLTGGKEVRPSAAPNPAGRTGVLSPLLGLLLRVRWLVIFLVLAFIVFVFVTAFAVRLILRRQERKAWKRHHEGVGPGGKAKEVSHKFDYFRYYQDLYRDLRRGP